MSQSNPARQSYDRLATIYDRRWRSYEEATLHAALEGISCTGTEHLLDLACGTGELERLLLDRWPKL
jgi:trans-aconitate methyltransferase